MMLERTPLLGSLPTGRMLVAFLLMLLASGVATGCGDEKDGGGKIVQGEEPRINISPSVVTFSTVVLGQTGEEFVLVRNTGQGTLEIDRIYIEGRDAELFSADCGAPGAGCGGKYVLETDDELEILVTYSAQRVGSATARFCALSNDPNSTTTCIDLNALETGPRIQITPNPVIFGQVPAGGEARIEVTVTNVGSAKAEFVTNNGATGISIVGSPDFSPLRGTREAVLHDAPEGLEPGESTSFEIAYRPPTQSPDSGEVIVNYYFGDLPDIASADITANGNEPCLRITPAEVDFGESIIGGVSQKIVTLENCGSGNLSVNSVALTSDTDPKYALASLPDSLANGMPEVIARGQTRQFYVTFSPIAEEASTGMLVVESDDPARPTQEVPIFGSGTFNSCPVPVALGRVVRKANGSAVNNPAPLAEQFSAEPLDFIELNGAQSNDPDGDQIIEYRWSIVKAPAGFSLGFEGGPRRQNTGIQLALVGDYTFELTVTDKHGREACEPARVDVRARSDRALIVELVWRTPSDLDETDTGTGAGTDLDLHLLAGSNNAFWTDRFGTTNPLHGGTDCHFSNLTPNWGNQTSADDDPALDRDDTDGGGPEQINIKRPAFTNGQQPDGYSKPYQVGVYFWESHGFAPPVLAQVRVYLDGSDVPSVIWPTVDPGQEQAAALVVSDPRSSGQGDFWLAGEIDWSSSGGELREINIIQSGFPQ